MRRQAKCTEFIVAHSIRCTWNRQQNDTVALTLNWRDSPHELSNSPNQAKFIVAHTVSAAAEIDNKTDERSMSCSASAVGGLVGQLVQDKC